MLPEVYDRYIRLNSNEPYRLKLSYVRARLDTLQSRPPAPREPVL